MAAQYIIIKFEYNPTHTIAININCSSNWQHRNFSKYKKIEILLRHTKIYNIDKYMIYANIILASYTIFKVQSLFYV